MVQLLSLLQSCLVIIKLHMVINRFRYYVSVFSFHKSELVLETTDSYYTSEIAQ